MKKFILTSTAFLIPALSFAAQTNLSPTPFPVFLKLGFSAMLKFAEAPVTAVLGDAESFQVEKLGNSLVVRTLVTEASATVVHLSERRAAAAEETAAAPAADAEKKD